jgi:hypothetical protein
MITLQNSGLCIIGYNSRLHSLNNSWLTIPSGPHDRSDPQQKTQTAQSI